jgi:pimeloyl-ACP methyl ester carboxylesterase
MIGGSANLAYFLDKRKGAEQEIFIMQLHPLLKFLFWLLMLYASYCVFLFLIQRHILYPRNLIPATSFSVQQISGLEKLWLNTQFGKVEAWFIPPTTTPDVKPSPAVIFGHGNGERIDFWPEELRHFSRLGLGLLLVEYPGYGRSAGKPSQESIRAAFVAGYDHLAARKEVDSNRIVLFGRSLGGGAVCALAERRASAAMILMSTFTSVKALTTRYLAPKFLVRDPFDNLNVVREYPGPILIIHGRHDEVIPFSHGLKLHQAAKSSKMVVYEAGHNDCPPDWSVFWKDVENFLRDKKIIQN